MQKPSTFFPPPSKEMAGSPCCDNISLKKGPWTAEEDEKLLAYIQEHGHGSWRSLPSKAGNFNYLSFHACNVYIF